MLERIRITGRIASTKPGIIDFVGARHAVPAGFCLDPSLRPAFRTCFVSPGAMAPLGRAPLLGVFQESVVRSQENRSNLSPESFTLVVPQRRLEPNLKQFDRNNHKYVVTRMWR
jgi:hypothetical protein